MSRTSTAAACLLGFAFLVGAAGGAAPPGRQASGALSDPMFAAATVETAVPPAARPFNLKAVRLLEGPFKQAMDRNGKYLLGLDPDRLLHSFRLTAGLPSSAVPYGGWEKPDGELRGHSLGHYLSGCSLMYAATGDARFKAKTDAVVAGLAECQEALGAGGYVSAFPVEFFDRVESVRRVWAPYYTLHKIMAGLIDAYEHCANAQALAVVEKMAAWVKVRTDASDAEHMERVLNFTEQGGMNEVLANLYSISGRPEHLDLARRFDERRYTEPLARSEDRLKGQHVNSFIPNVIGTAREYEMTGDPVLRHMASFFWNQVTGARSFVTGGTSNHERWGEDPFVISPEIGSTSHETCCTYNMLKLTRHLFGWDAAAARADYYERALWNGILATQNPADGMVMYYVAMKPGLYRTFQTPEDSFWCCTGTGMESHAKYGDSIYFHDDDGLFVNLYIASEVDWAEKGFKLRQETRFPDEPKTVLTVTAERPVELTLRIRVPGWIAPGGGARLNGRPLGEFASPSSYFTVRRTWKTGDRIEVALPMALRVERVPDEPSMIALLYGPLVLAGRLGGGDGLTREMVYGKYGPEGEPAPVPRLDIGAADPAEWLKAVAGSPLTFRTDGVGRPADVTLIPFFRLFGERYAVYWETEEPRESRRRPQ